MAKPKKEPIETKKIITKVTASKDVVELTETTGTIDKQNPPFDPDIPEQKQRWLR